MSGSIIEIINKYGVFFCDHALRMLIQSSILIAVLLVIDLLIRKHIKAVLRYCIWLLVFVKLVTPTTLSLPTGIGYWLSDLLPEKTIQNEVVKEPQITFSTESFTLSKPSSFEPANNISAILNEPAITIETPSVKIQGIIFSGWIISEFILFALLLQRTFFIKKIIAQSKTPSGNLLDILSDSCKKINVRNKIELRISQSLLSPATCGLLKPKIILPHSLLKHFSSEKLRTTMLHELAHIKRKDIWINSLQTFLLIFYFYNPLLWIANIIVRRIREQAVDETVLVYLGQKADTYSSTLVDIAEIAFSRPSLGVNIISVVESQKALVARIRHITSRPFPTNAKPGIFGIITIFIVACISLPMVRAQKTNVSDLQTDSSLYANLTNDTPSPFELIRQTRIGETGSSNAETPKPERIIHFPKDRSLGKLYLYDKTQHKRFSYWFHWDWNIFTRKEYYFCEAQGDVNVPAGKELYLTIYYEALKDLSPLLYLRPDDLFGIDFDISDRYLPPTDEVMPYISKLTGLKSLSLKYTDITDEGMKYITNLKSLEILDLPEGVTDRGMTYVAQLTSLKKLFVKETGSLLTDLGIQYISKLTNLEELALSGNNMGDNGLVYIKDLLKLEYLFIRGINFGDYGMIHIRNMKSLKMLSFYESDSYISDAGLVHISEIPNLEYLCLHAMRNITDEGIAHLIKMKSLKEINIEGSQVTDKGLYYLSQIKTLEHIQLPQQQKGITDVGVSYLANLPNLKDLGINRIHYSDPKMDTEYYTDKALEALSKCKTLEILGIGSLGVTDVGLGHIAKLPNLKELTLYGCDNITNQGMANLSKLKSLQGLTISRGQITISGINHLNSLTNLTRLEVYLFKPDSTILDLSALTSLDKLRCYPIPESRIFTDEDLKSLSGLKNLTWLHLLSADYTDKGMSYLTGLTNMERLIICGNRITDEGLKYLANMKRLSLLSIYDSNITDKGLRYLEGFEQLRTIDITSDNDFSDAALQQLMDKMPYLGTLKINGARFESINR